MGKPAIFIHAIDGSVFETNWRPVLHYLLTVRIHHMCDPGISLSGICPPVTLVYMCKVMDPVTFNVVLFVIAEDMGFNLEGRGLSIPSPRLR